MGILVPLTVVTGPVEDNYELSRYFACAYEVAYGSQLRFLTCLLNTTGSENALSYQKSAGIIYRIPYNTIF